MTRIQPNATPDAKAQPLLDGVKKALGTVPNIYQTLAHSPAALAFQLQGSQALAGGLLPATLREQLALTLAGANGCDYCASAHTALGKMRKINDAELAQNLAGKSGDAKTQAALTFALKVLNGRGHVADADFEAVRAAGYSDAEIIEIIAHVAANVFTNYFNEAIGTVVDFPKVSAKPAQNAA